MKSRSNHTQLVALLIFTLLFVAVIPARRANAATISVSTFADELNSDGDCSLREAIQAANTNTAIDACAAGSGADTIILAGGTLSAPATYTLSLAGAGEDLNATGDLDLLSTLTIKGVDAATTRIDGAGIDRVFQIPSGAAVTLSGISIVSGHTDQSGGAIYNRGSLMLNGVTLQNNQADADGGGLFNDGGIATINDSTISDNQANNGGGIENSDGTITLSNATINNNTATTGDGGGVRNHSTLVVQGSWIHDNYATIGDGAGIYNTAAATISTTTIQDNVAYAGAGGNIYSGDSVGLSTLAIASSTVLHGFAWTNGGGIFNDGALNLTNTTLTTNRANLGDGIYNAETTQPISLANTTIVSNTNPPESAGEGLYNEGAALRLKNTLVAFNGSSGDCSGLIASDGYNLEYSPTPGFGNTCTLTATGDITGANPLLGGFNNYGGKTATYPLLAGSPALNAGTNTGCPTADQRGVSRPHGPRCDIGAYEANAAPAAQPNAYIANEDTPLLVGQPGILGNDSDPDADLLAASLVLGPVHGALTLNQNGSFSYMPALNFHGADSFSYRVSDGSLISPSAIVTLTVNSVNDAPIAASDLARTSSDTPLALATAILLSNDSDPDGDALSISGVGASSAHGGTAVLAGSSVIYTPPLHFAGTDSLTYVLNDGHGGIATGSVTIAVELQRLYLPLVRK
jgi:CSLREA domain-containing protein